MWIWYHIGNWKTWNICHSLHTSCSKPNFNTTVYFYEIKICCWQNCTFARIPIDLTWNGSSVKARLFDYICSGLGILEVFVYSIQAFRHLGWYSSHQTFASRAIIYMCKQPMVNYLLYFHRGTETLGPYVVMIGKMLSGDILKFWVIMSTFLTLFATGKKELQGVREKIVQRKSALVWCQFKSKCEWNIYECHKWSFGFWMPFISANLDVAIRRYCDFSKDKIMHKLLTGAYRSCWLEWIHSSHNIQ